MRVKKSFTETFIALHIDHPEVATVKCCCAGRKHSVGCGCITEGFIRNARINHFLACVQADQNPAEYARKMRELGKYHARGTHTWEDGKCSFHPQLTCSCGKCNEELKCEGKPYQSKYILSCPLHSMVYELECEARARKASSVIHDKLGKGHLNLCEAAFNVLPRFRAKKLVLHRLTYMTLTNWGLIICCLVYGSDYSPYVELYTEMGLPILDGMVALWTEDMERRTAHLKQMQTPEVKCYRIHMKSARVVDQQERKQWAKRQQIQHSYGIEDDDSGDSDTEVRPLPTVQGNAIADGAVLVVSEDNSTGKQLQTSKNSKGPRARKPCRCGSTTHSRITFRGCPLNKSAARL